MGKRTDSLSKVSRLQVPVGPLTRAYHAQNRQIQENSNSVRIKPQNQKCQIRSSSTGENVTLLENLCLLVVYKLF